MVAVRPARPEEVASLVTESLDSFVAHHAELGQAAHDLAQRGAAELRSRYAPQDRLHDGDTILVAEHRGERVAHVWLCQHATLLPAAFVLDIAVHPSQRRRGTGRQLLHVARDWALSRGLPRLALHVLAGNSAARALYDAEGYAEVNRVATGPVHAGAWWQAPAHDAAVARDRMVSDLVRARFQVGDVAPAELEAVAAGAARYLLRDGALHPGGMLLSGDGSLGYVIPAGSAGVVAWVAEGADLGHVARSAQAYGASQGWTAVQVSYHTPAEETMLVAAGFTPTDVNLVKDLRAS